MEALPPPPSGIIGGQNAATCAWPTAVAVSSGYSLCTGTLVHPRVVIYAAHCGSNVDRIRFGEQSSPASKTQSVDFCRTNPSYGGTSDQAHDWAFCRLSAAVPLAPTPVVYGCETSMLTAGREVAIVGFGDNSGSGGAGTKRWAMTSINQAYSNTLSIGGNGTGVCPGDSGGPAFIEYSDGTWHAAGIASTVSGGCGGVGTHSRMDGAVAWVEQESGIDITPCHNVDGTWTPTPDCAGFFAGEPTGHGTWSSWCDATPVGGSSETCGPPFDADPDNDPPTITITSPNDGQTYDTAPTTIDITMDANDGGGWGVVTVEIEINGDVQPIIDEVEPWQFSGVTFPEGQYTLVAIATDHAGNEGRSAAIGIGVGEEAPDPPPPPTDTDTGGDGGGTGDDGGTGDGGVPGDDGGTDDGGTDDDGGTSDESDDGGPGGYPFPDGRYDNETESCACTAGQTTHVSALWLMLLFGLRRRRE